MDRDSDTRTDLAFSARTLVLVVLKLIGVWYCIRTAEDAVGLLAAAVSWPRRTRRR
jgi:hypothetical protein